MTEVQKSAMWKSHKIVLRGGDARNWNKKQVGMHFGEKGMNRRGSEK